MLVKRAIGVNCLLLLVLGLVVIRLFHLEMTHFMGYPQKGFSCYH